MVDLSYLTYDERMRASVFWGTRAGNRSSLITHAKEQRIATADLACRLARAASTMAASETHNLDLTPGTRWQRAMIEGRDWISFPTQRNYGVSRAREAAGSHPE